MNHLNNTYYKLEQHTLNSTFCSLYAAFKQHIYMYILGLLTVSLMHEMKHHNLTWS